ncbi:MAG: HD domain-containing protein [Lachnospiraceae bacterium]|nr:HD domain-containing protein [Lachnospiraceae bacterium]
MDKKIYGLLEEYMVSCMDDSAHDKEHVYRVLYNALDIARTEKNVDYDVLICACLLHDIGRKEQFENPALCHAMVGGEKAYDFLVEHGFGESYAEKVKCSIQTHRYRKSNPPRNIEAKILFDADKLDVSGAIGIARTLIYKGIVSEPLYSLLPDGMVSNGENDVSPSFFQEYKYKLENLYSNFYTERAAEVAKERQQIAVDFYNCLYQEANIAYQSGRIELDKIIQ